MKNGRKESLVAMYLELFFADLSWASDCLPHDLIIAKLNS